MVRIRFYVFLVLALCVAGARLTAAGSLTDSATATDSSAVTFTWTYVEDPANPVIRPEWVGWDVVRRTIADCSAFVRVNATPYPRTPGATETFTFSEPAPVRHALIEYRVVPVDAARQPVQLYAYECDGCALPGYVTCPDLSAPLAVGKVTDLGWAVMVMPCAGTCYTSFYVPNPTADALRPYLGTASAVRLFGTPACGTLEGCTLTLDHFDVTTCDAIVPARASTWGSIKTRYR